MNFFKNLVATLTRGDSQRAGAKRQMPEAHSEGIQGVHDAGRLREEALKDEQRALEKVQEFDHAQQEERTEV